ncbi:integrase family protein [Hydrogenophaga sp.]|uniref:tyrosine-type recombinase/integrase n=1 Tax=Hydrogenophaga sp. TaxID=1904254 RepID=UPI002724E56E|nr:integrase family protein [Hydrogenophaga sp.]MDO8904729.1 integrase family protein [Hydrogenophaga sp.]
MAATKNRVRLTAGRVESFTCPPGKSQAFLWDTEAPTLALRATPTGRKTYVFESRLNGASLRINIGTLAATLEQARTKATALAVMVDSGIDPREVERQQQADKAAQAVAADARALAAQQEAVTVGEVWAAYLTERRPFWGELHYRDHLDKAKAGGEPSKRRGADKDAKTQPGPLAALMPLPLKDLDQATIERWAATEGKTRPSSARLAWRLLTVFLTWCGEQPQYARILPAKNPAKTKKAREALGRPGVKSDVLTREQLPAWFAQVRQIQNPCIAAALQVMLLTGARPGEVMGLRWEDLNTQWKGISFRDKVEGTREIPLTPYVASLLAALPRRNEWVFSSAYALDMSAHNIKRRAVKAANKGTDAPEGDVKNRSAEGRLTEPNTPHTRACMAAGLEGLTLHGLRRSFKSLTEWLEVPVGVVAQIQGHKPSATAEKHYTVRPLDLLRLHHERIEAWVLQQAGVQFDPKAEPGKLRAVM